MADTKKTQEGASAQQLLDGLFAFLAPGKVPPGIVAAMNVTLALLLLCLAFLAYAGVGMHVYIFGFLALCLFFSVHWFLSLIDWDAVEAAKEEKDK